MQESYKYEGFIKNHTRQEYEQEGGEILIDCKRCKDINKDSKVHIQLETGKYCCDNPECFNEGNLARYIVEQEGISNNMAEKIVNEYDGLYEFAEEIGVSVETLKKSRIRFVNDKIIIPYYAEDNQELAVKEIERKKENDYFKETIII